MSKNGHIGPYINAHQNITNYITIVSRVNYTLIQTCIDHNVTYMFYKNIRSKPHVGFLLKTASSERRLQIST